MIECKKLKAIIPESTCIARQKIIHRGSGGWRESAIRFHCTGCAIGLKLLKEEREKNVMSDEKTCKTCGKTYPRTTEYFEPAPAARDKLRLDCRNCTSGDRGVTLTHRGVESINSEQPAAPVAAPTALSRHHVGTKSTHPKEPAERKFIQINLKKAPGLWELLQDDAEKNIRSPVDQALWLLKEALQ